MESALIELDISIEAPGTCRIDEAASCDSLPTAAMLRREC
jgi:hypothetical protein